jgi:hypothetical protein
LHLIEPGLHLNHPDKRLGITYTSGSGHTHQVVDLIDLLGLAAGYEAAHGSTALRCKDYTSITEYTYRSCTFEHLDHLITSAKIGKWTSMLVVLQYKYFLHAIFRSTEIL